MAPPQIVTPLGKRRNNEKFNKKSRELTRSRCLVGVLSSLRYRSPSGKRPNFRNPAEIRHPRSPGRVWISPDCNTPPGKQRNSKKFKKNSRELIRRRLGGVLSSRGYTSHRGAAEFQEPEEIRYRRGTGRIWISPDCNPP